MDLRARLEVGRKSTILGQLAGIFASLAPIFRLLQHAGQRIQNVVRLRPVEARSGTLPSRINHPLILAGAVVLLGAVSVSFAIVLTPDISLVETRYTVANTLAITGLVLSVLSWTVALYLSLRLNGLRRWAWFIGLLLSGLALYLPAVTSGRFWKSIVPVAGS